MKNAHMEIKGDKLTITVDLKQRFGASGSGKTLIVASTEGNISVDGAPDVKIGLNIYVPNPDYTKGKGKK